MRGDFGPRPQQCAAVVEQRVGAAGADGRGRDLVDDDDLLADRALALK